MVAGGDTTITAEKTVVLAVVAAATLIRQVPAQEYPHQPDRDMTEDGATKSVLKLLAAAAAARRLPDLTTRQAPVAMAEQA